MSTPHRLLGRGGAVLCVAILVFGACSESTGPGSTAPTSRPPPTLNLPRPVGSGLGLAPPALGGPGNPVGGGGGAGGNPGYPGNPVGGGGGAGGNPANPGNPGNPGNPANPGGIPDWVRPGVRIAWYAAAASVAQSRYSWVEDPTGPWEDPKTGKHYRRTDEGVNGAPSQDQPTASGDGISQIDVLAVEGVQVVLSNNLYAFDRTGNQQAFTWSPGPGAKVPGGIVDGAWIDPSQLAQALDQGIAGLLVLRGPYALDGTTYSAVSFVNSSGSAYVSYTYDAQTGILLNATTTTGGATSPFSAPGENAPVGNSQLTITRFLGMRQRNVPGIGSAVPAFAARGGTFTYTGTYLWTNPVDPPTGAAQYPMTYQVQLSPGGQTWMGYRAQSVIQGFLGAQPEQSSVAGGDGSGYWLDPAALANLQSGQVLDRDPNTGEQDVVSGRDGASVAIDSQLPGVFQRRRFLAQSGALVTYDLQTPGSGVQIHLQLQANP